MYPDVNLRLLASPPTFYSGSRHLANLEVENPTGVPLVYAVRLSSGAFVDGSFLWPDVSLAGGASTVLHNWFTMVDQVGIYECSAVVEELTTQTVLPQKWFDNIELVREPVPEFYLIHLEPWDIAILGELPWDFDPDPDFPWILDTTNFFIAPSSLRMNTYRGQYRMKGTLCTVPSAMNLPEGRVVTYFMPGNGYVMHHVLFRNQCPTYPETGFYGTKRYIGFKDTYDLQFSSYSSNAWLTKCLDTTRSGVGNWKAPFKWMYGQWQAARITWWRFGASLVTRLEYWDDGQWVPIFPDVFDHSPAFEGSQINRVGVGYSRPNLGGYVWCDETEIYGVSR